MSKKTYPEIDRRKYNRKKDNIKVKYTVASQRKIIKEAERQNIGAGGIKMVTHENIPEGSILALRIDLPGIRDRFPIFATGKVVWREEIEDMKGKKYGLGIEFISIDEDDKKEIIEYVNLPNK